MDSVHSSLECLPACLIVIRIDDFQKFQEVPRHTWVSLAARSFRTTAIEGTLVTKNGLCWQQCFFSHRMKVRGLCYHLSLTAYTCQDVCVQQSHAVTSYCHNLKWTFENLLPYYCYATKANSRTMRSQVSQSAFALAGKGADLLNCKLITAWHHNSEPDSCAVWVSCP